MVYFDFYGKFKRMYDIVACDYFVQSKTLILHTVEGHRWIFVGANEVKVTEDVVFQPHLED